MTNYAPGLTRITATVAGKERFFTRDVQSGLLANPSLFIFWAGGGDSSVKFNKLFGKFLQKYNAIGIYMEALPSEKKENFDVLSPPATNKDVQFYNYILQQFPNAPFWVAGSSTGACMCIYLGVKGYCDSIATFAGSVWEGLTISYKPNVFACHGQGDVQVPFAGSSPGRLNHGLHFLPAYSSIEKFSAAPIKRTVTSYPLTGQLNTYTSSNQPNKVQLLTVANLKHNILSYKGVVNGMGLIESMFYWFSNLPVVK